MTQGEVLKEIRKMRVHPRDIWDERTKGKAPHKPFMLFAVMDGIALGWISKNKVKIDDDLVDAFYRYWKRLALTNHQTTIAYPFVYLKSSDFWEIVYKPDVNPYSDGWTPTLAGIDRRISHARLDDGFYNMMQSVEGRSEITEVLLDGYFDVGIHDDIREIRRDQVSIYQYADELVQLVASPFEPYHRKPTDTRYQKQQVREPGFSLLIRKNYGHKCAICRSKIKTEKGTSLVDGAHIIPWNQSYNDDPRNGLALCKTHHWMFDQYLLTIDPESFQLKISNWLKQKGERVDETLARDGEEVLVPDDEQYLPSELALKDHYKRFSEVK
ncbi:MAG: HNH endonuclease [Bacteroidota bacterium]